MLRFTTYVPDPIWGPIPITKMEERLVRTKTFSRLQQIKQMSLAYVTFVAAHHTRYAHSIGAMHVAGRLANGMPSLEQHLGPGRYEHALQLLRVSALLHDLGHPPFSHAVEWAFDQYAELRPKWMKQDSAPHEEFTHRMIVKDKQIREIFEDFSSTSSVDAYYRPEVVVALLEGDFEQLRRLGVPELGILHPLLDGDIDADKIDYIIRDNYHCGFPTAINIDEVAESLSVIDSTAGGTHSAAEPVPTPRIAVYKHRLNSVETILQARMRLITHVHNEPRNRAANLLLMGLMAEFLRSDPKRTNSLVNDMHTSWNDSIAYAQLHQTDDKRLRTLAEYVFRGEVPKSICNLLQWEMAPEMRADAHLVHSRRTSIARAESHLRVLCKEEVTLDFGYVSPPPLRLPVKVGNDGQSRFVHSESGITRGILRDSVDRSFISVYAPFSVKPRLRAPGSEAADAKAIGSHVIRAIQEEAVAIRTARADEGQISLRDLILLVLYGILRFERKHFPNASVWIYAVNRFQKFAYQVLDDPTVSLKVLGGRSPGDEYDPTFFKELDSLVLSGLVEQRTKLIRRYDSFPTRHDHRLNSFGEDYAKRRLISLYPSISDVTFERHEKVAELVRDLASWEHQAEKVEAGQKFDNEVQTKHKALLNSGAMALVL